MASRSFARAIHAGSKRNFLAPIAQRCPLVAARHGGLVSAAGKASGPGVAQQIRGVKTIDFAGHKEQVFGMIDDERPNDGNLEGLQANVAQNVEIGLERSFL